MTVFAFVLFVFAFERPLGVFVVGERQAGPGAGDVTA